MPAPDDAQVDVPVDAPLSAFKKYSTWWVLALHNAHIVEYLYLATEQAGTYLQSPLVLHHLTYIDPTLFGCEIYID